MTTHSSTLPGGSLGQRSLEGYSSWGRKEADMTEQLSAAQHRAHVERPLLVSTLSTPIVCAASCFHFPVSFRMKGFLPTDSVQITFATFLAFTKI